MAERGAGRIFPFPPALVAWLSFLEPITKAIHFQGTHPSSDGAYGLARGGGAASLGHTWTSCQVPKVRRTALFWGFQFSGIIRKDGLPLSIPVSLPEPGHSNTLLLSQLTPLGRSRAFIERRQQSVRAEPPVSLFTVGATEGQTHPHLPERPLPTLPANPG